MILESLRRGGAWIASSSLALVLAVGCADAATSDGTTQITVRAGKADNPNYPLARQFAEALAIASNGAFALEVKESQGTVQNVIDAPKNGANVIFTASRAVIVSARRGHQPFTPNPGYFDIRALFPIPAQTVHWVVRQDSGIATMTDLAGHTFVPGANGSVSQRITASALQVLGLDKKVQLIDIDAASAPDAVMSNKVSGLAMAGSFPIARIVDLAKATPIRLLSLPAPVIAKMVAADDSILPQTIPKNTYSGIDSDVTTVAVPVGIYTTRRMSADTAYALTKAFWSQLGALGDKNGVWHAITGDAVGTLGITLHPGALRYYKEAGIAVPKSMR